LDTLSSGSETSTLLNTIFETILPHPRYVRAFIPLLFSYPICVNLQGDDGTSIVPSKAEMAVRSIICDPELKVHVGEAVPAPQVYPRLGERPTGIHLNSTLVAMYEEVCSNEDYLYYPPPGSEYEPTNGEPINVEKDDLEILILLIILHELGHYILRKRPIDADAYNRPPEPPIKTEQTFLHRKVANSNILAYSTDGKSVRSLLLFEPGQAVEASLFGGAFEVVPRDRLEYNNEGERIPHLCLSYHSLSSFSQTPPMLVSAPHLTLASFFEWSINPIPSLINPCPFIDWEPPFCFEKRRWLSLGVINRTHLSPNGEEDPFASALATPPPEGWRDDGMTHCYM